MRLDQSTWYEVKTYLEKNQGIILPTGSIEQHGPIGLIGTDALVATLISERAADICGALVSPTFSLSPAPFNSTFCGTISISPKLFTAIVLETLECLSGQGFKRFYFLNAHGANKELICSISTEYPEYCIHVRSWWEFESVNRLRHELYGEWEGMHATPSEIAITQSEFRCPPIPVVALNPPRKLTQNYIISHSGDRHGPAYEHKQDFPDGRVGSHSVLAKPEHGTMLLNLAVQAVAEEFQTFTMHSMHDFNVS